MSDTKPSRTVVRTITDLARIAGVSPGTVSRALAGKSLVNTKTREKIEALAREHGFRLDDRLGFDDRLGLDDRAGLQQRAARNNLGHLADLANGSCDGAELGQCPTWNGRD